MSDSILFLPWLRTGLAATIQEVAVDGLSDGSPTSLSLSVAVEAVRADGGVDRRELPPRTVGLQGPGSVTALHDAQIVRRYPEPGATDPELNYFCAIEFSSPDFPWRFTPVKPDADNRLPPWLALVVVEDIPGALGQGSRGLDVLHVADAAAQLPPPADIWAWAHVQVETDDPGADPVALWRSNPAALRSRLLCPRRLTPDTSWIACVVPTFEAGRLAGLGLPNSDAVGLAWGTGPVELPVYHSWRFSTSAPGDFESLVRRLRPVELPASVGIRDLDISHPGGGLPDADGTILSFVGALVAPAAVPRVWEARHRRRTEAALRNVLRDDVPQPPPGSDYDPLEHDPVVRPALYGSAQSQRESLGAAPADGAGDGSERAAAPRWMRQLNLDPAVRAVAGIGSAVVRRDQEQLMDAAWDAAKGLDQVNQRLRAATLALHAGMAVQTRLRVLPPERILQFAGPSLARIDTGSGTVLRTLGESDLPDNAGAGAYRRIARPAGPVARRLGVPDPATEVNRRLLAAPDGPISSHTRVAVPAGCDVAGLERDVTPDADDPARDIAPEIRRWIDPGVDGTTVGRLDQPVPAGPRFPPSTGRGVEVVGRPTRDRIVVAQRPPTRPRSALSRTPRPSVTSAALAAAVDCLDVDAAIASRLRATIQAPPEAWRVPVPSRMWASPSFRVPLYSRVRELSVEYLVPGAGNIPDESVGLLETNDRYVESLLIGANHELSREFLWREYPAQLNGTWFRQFWNAPEPDIEPIGAWRPQIDLGSQDGSAQADLVIVIKGTFPRRYPDVHVFVARAEWTRDETHDRWFRDVRTGGERRAPVLAGQLQPGVIFYGFDLSAREALGDPLETPGRGDAGWFFVLEEQPRGVRFGLDNPDGGQVQGRGAAPSTWNDLTWANVTPAGSPEGVTFVDLAATPWLTVGALPGAGGSDVWGADAAGQARITLQRPVQLKVHASAMLGQI